MSNQIRNGATRCGPHSRTKRCTGIAGSALAVLALVAAIAAAPVQAVLPPLNLQVEGGEDRWHAGTRFGLHWTNPSGPIVAVHYRLLDPQGKTLTGEKTLPWAATSLDHLSVPPVPGECTVEIWLEDSKGEQGAAASAKLRFDNSRPGEVEPLPQPGWIGRTSFPYAIRFSHPGGPQPLSGIRGYAVSVDRSASGDPCPSGACSEIETDLQGGVGGDRLWIGELPEGTNYVHAVAVSGSGVPSAFARTAILHVDKNDPETVISGVSDGWSKTPVSLTVLASDAESGMTVEGPGSPFTAIRIDGGAPTVAAGNRATATVIDSGVHRVDYYARDAAGNVNDGGLSNGLPSHSPATVLVKVDREPPRLAFAPAQNPFDPERIEVGAADSHAGVDLSRGSIAVRRLGSGERFARLPTELSAGKLRARWDSSAYPAGEYEFRATAFDRAGNSATTSTRANGTAMRLRGPLKSAVRIVTENRARTIRYGRRTWFSGNVIGGRRTPLAGMTVRVVERFPAGSTPAERFSTVRTDANGKFGLRLAPGPSRQVTAEVAATATTRGASSEPLALAVATRLVLRASSTRARVGGSPVVFHGKVANGGAALPTDGKVVQLQFRLAGLPWSEFRTFRTDRQGRFRYAYRFSDDDSRGVRFQFRAYAPAQAGWPYEPAGSLPVAVLGT